MNLSRSKQKNARALNPRSLLSLEKKTRKKKKKKKKGTQRVVDRRGVLLLPKQSQTPLFARARFCAVGAKKTPRFFKGFFGGGRKKKKGNKCLSAPWKKKKKKKKKKGHKKKI